MKGGAALRLSDEDEWGAERAVYYTLQNWSSRISSITFGYDKRIMHLRHGYMASQPSVYSTQSTLATLDAGYDS